jgi:hypothetical protein
MALLHFRVRTRTVVPRNSSLQARRSTMKLNSTKNVSTPPDYIDSDWSTCRASVTLCFLVSISYSEPIFLFISRVGALIQSFPDSRTKCRSMYPCTVKPMCALHIILKAIAHTGGARWQHGDVILNEFSATS